MLLLGVNLRRIYPLPDDKGFDELSCAIDRAIAMQRQS